MPNDDAFKHDFIAAFQITIIMLMRTFKDILNKRIQFHFQMEFV